MFELDTKGWDCQVKAQAMPIMRAMRGGALAVSRACRTLLQKCATRARNRERASLRQLVHHVFRDALDHGIVPAQAVRPIGGAASEDDALVFLIDPEDGIADAVLLEAFVPQAIVGMPFRGAGAKDDERLGRAVAIRGVGQAVLPGNL